VRVDDPEAEQRRDRAVHRVSSLLQHLPALPPPPPPPPSSPWQQHRLKIMPARVIDKKKGTKRK
jgi:hypothetical protein